MGNAEIYSKFVYLDRGPIMRLGIGYKWIDSKIAILLELERVVSRESIISIEYMLRQYLLWWRKPIETAKQRDLGRLVTLLWVLRNFW